MEVQAGPFAGLKYPGGEATASVLFPKILGYYESELHETIEQIIKNGYDHVVNIGAAEGYYTVGLLQRLPRIKVHAFEMSDQMRRLCCELAELNGVSERLRLAGKCEVANLSDTLAGLENVLIISDCEGAEIQLLDPLHVPCIQKADILVEMHDYGCSGPTVCEQFWSRFSPSHSVIPINMRYLKPRTEELDATLTSFEKDATLAQRRTYSVAWLFLKHRRQV